MRLIKRDYHKKPVILTSTDVEDTLAKLLTSGNSTEIRESLYQDAYEDSEGKRQMRVRDELNVYYLGKCAYCESNCKAEVEHYRPKRGGKGSTSHNGYYWLCYEWSNLLPACHDCNTAGGKGNQFPIYGKRVNKPSVLPSGQLDPAQTKPDRSPLIDEQPYLLHPEIDDPSTFLGVEIDPKGQGLKLKELDGPNQRGDQTIQICNLNRTNLKISRLRTLDEYITGINLVFQYLIKGVLHPQNLELALRILFEQMDSNAADIRLEHTLLRRYVVVSVVQFSSIVVPFLELSQQQIVLAAFTEYRAQNPF